MTECTRYAVRQMGTELFAGGSTWRGPVRLQLAKLFVREADAKARANRFTRRRRGVWEVVKVTVRIDDNATR